MQRSRWIVPVAVAGLIAGGSAVSSAVADGPPSVRSASVAQVLASVAGSHVTALSGTVQTRAQLGLPDLSALRQLGGSSSRSTASATDPQTLLTRFLSGENTLRVWADGPSRQRAQLIDPFDEIDVVRDGTSLWTYSAKQDVAARGTVPADAMPADTQPGRASSLTDLPTPATLAAQALAQLDPTTAVTLAAPATVAGRATYTLVLTPRTTATLVDRVVLNVDAENGVPLRVGVYARGQADAAVLTGFTSVSFSRPDAARFQFTPPRTARIEQLPALDGVRPPHDLAKPGAATSDAAKPAAKPGAAKPVGASAERPTVIGVGWATIVESRAGATSDVLSGAAAGGVLDQLTTPVTGGRAVHTSLFSVLLTDDGRVLAGAVPVQALVDTAAK